MCESTQVSDREDVFREHFLTPPSPPMAPTINNAMAPLATRAKAPPISATEAKNSVRMTKSASGVGIPDVVHRGVGQWIRPLGRHGAEEQFAPEDDLPKFIFPFLFLFA